MKIPQAVLPLFLSLVAAVSMWFYVDVILVRYQIAEEAAHQRPRGNLSDLYPRWLGARELLQHGKNPYGNEVTLEIQKGYYGRELNPLLPDDPKDRQAFAYPVYVVFLLAPTIDLPFGTVRSWSVWVLAGLSIASVWLWLRVLRWRLPFAAKCTVGILLLGSFPAVQGIKLQQLTLLVAALLAGAATCVSAGYLFLGGVLMAFATIKPQLALPLAFTLLLWAASQWKTRWRFAAGLAFTMGILLGASEVVLPGWWKMFWHAIHDYRDYTDTQSVLDQFLGGALAPWGGRIVSLAVVVAAALLLWKFRRDINSQNLGRAVAFVIALTVLIVPKNAPYNQVLLLPSILLLAHDWRALTSGSRSVRLIYGIAVFALAWPWLATSGLMALWFFSAGAATSAYRLPLYTTFTLPLLIFVLTFVSLRRTAILRAREGTE